MNDNIKHEYPSFRPRPYLANEYRSILLCIDSYDEKNLRGRIYNPYLKEGQRFENAMQFLTIAEELFDNMDYPQPFTQSRSFWNNPCYDKEKTTRRKIKEDIPQNGELTNFALRVIFRQNASWQGSLIWLNENKEDSFRCVLELLKLIDNACESANK